ncbi:PSD1 and planctomycete cytochrome C domain-containing protein [Planctellipticum variicoloris]|uniref:PSD1 and planctomycete cytochrome C domain-containing protein n=1 Tax=Planctellipticum variicoloris TaxID=3064265 RepID=UPI0030140850|nr:PSD1 and planctomycete cytochrome C domain-containing protein [Planctomycetaceae bacterium SH412]
MFAIYRRWFVACFIGLAAPSSLCAAEPVDYTRQIKPLLKARCYACHGALKQEAGLRLDTARSMQQTADGAPVVKPGLPDKSPLLDRLTAELADGRMPPEGHPLAPEEIAAIRAWIAAGAPSPDREEPEQDPRQHWAFQTVVRPAVPTLDDSAWSRNPIDSFIAAELTRQGLTPQPPAAKSALLRRVTLDLTGLPPTRGELQAFLADDAPDAYERLVDRLLASPQHGERWARHWMDVWRYSDWYGRRMVPDVWNSAPQIWRWRDWIVRSLNADKGYDRMVAEMLAADEIAPEDPEAGYATGYLIRNWYALNPNDWMRSNVEHAGKAFLGLTFNCAHCHDHKYDPITQEDYFRLRAFFEPIGIRQDRVPGEADPGPFQEYNYSTLRKVVRIGSVQIFDKSPDAPTWFYTGGDERNRVADKGSIAPGFPAFLASTASPIEPRTLPPRAWYPGLQPGIQDTLLAETRSAITASETALAASRRAIETALPPLQMQLAQAETAFAAARQSAAAVSQSSALSGRQSLLLDATAGRRLVQRTLPHLSPLVDGTELQFQLRILKDAHVNFQLAKDHLKGLTAGYVAFDQGRIVSYKPGSFTELEVGRYSFAAGQRQFEVSLQFQPAADQCLLTIHSHAPRQLLVENVPVALNGWNPAGDPTKAISFDAHTGSVAAFDDVLLIEPGATQSHPASALAPSRPLESFDFEPPLYPEGRDVVGVDGWIGSSFSQAPATSLISLMIDDPQLQTLLTSLRAARQAVAAQKLQLQALTAREVAARAELTSLEARIAADRARFGETPGADVESLTRTASLAHRDAALKTAQADLLAAEQALAAAEAKPASDASRAKEIDAAGKQIAAKQTALQQAQTAFDDPAQAMSYPPLSPTYPSTSTGRRKALVEWIGNRQNPLTARVAVNHIWLRHFHAPLVATVSDFGRNGAAPTHPALLDWLAAELMDSGWSMRHLHRLIVTSEAYRMSSAAGSGTEHAQSVDPENHSLWRMNVGRMEAEVLRDSLLYSANRLDGQIGGQELENKVALTTFRRTLYYSCNPELDGKSQFGALFDAPEPADCYRRTRSVIPQQALALTNSQLVHELSGVLATQLQASLPVEQQSQPDAFIIAASEQILARSPTDRELQLCRQFLSPPTAPDVSTDPQALRESLVRALLNHNDFVAIR